MASTTFNCPTCGPYTGGCCPTCAPAQSIFQGECPDPGTLNPGRFLEVLDYKFCRRRLTNGSGFLVANQNGSGNFGIGFTTTPQVQLAEYLATKNVNFGNIVVMGADYRWRYLQGPSTLGLFLQTDANGRLFLGDPPAATVPDPLVVNNLNVAVQGTFAALTTNSTVTHNNIAAGTPVSLLGLNAANHLVTQNIASSIAASMFYEATTSPSPDAPNKAAANGSYLVIGNRLYDSGASLITVTTAQALTVAVAGKYAIYWAGVCRLAQNAKACISLEINGVIVNNGNGRADSEITDTGANTQQIAPFTGIEVRNLAVGDVIKLQLTRSAAGSTFQVRLAALKFADA